MLSGVYANAVMIGHTPSEFWFDFITNFYPRSAVASRVYLSAQQVPALLQTLTTSYQAHQRKQSGGQQPPPHCPHRRRTTDLASMAADADGRASNFIRPANLRGHAGSLRPILPIDAGQRGKHQFQSVRSGPAVPLRGQRDVELDAPAPSRA